MTSNWVQKSFVSRRKSNNQSHRKEIENEYRTSNGNAPLNWVMVAPLGLDFLLGLGHLCAQFSLSIKGQQLLGYLTGIHRK